MPKPSGGKHQQAMSPPSLAPRNSSIGSARARCLPWQRPRDPVRVPTHRVPERSHPRGVLVFGLGGQSRRDPGGVGRCVLIGDLHHRALLLSGQIPVRSQRVPRLLAWHPGPPRPPIAQVHRPAGRSDHERAGGKLVRFEIGKGGPAQAALGDRHVTGGLYKKRVLGTCSIGK